MEEKEIRFFGNDKKKVIYAAAITAFLLGLVIRRFLIRYPSRDWLYYWEPWLNELSEKGFRALAGDFYNYAPSYMYFMWIISKFGARRMALLKLITIGFDLIESAIAGLIVYEICGSRTRALIGGSIIWLSPVVISNSSMWGQCDAIYTTFLLLMVLFLLKDRSDLAMVFLGISFAFKLQALFTLPIVILFWVFKKIDNKDLVFIPIPYLISIVPAWIAGRPLRELFGIYFGQAGTDTNRLSMKYPNIYYIIGEMNLSEWYGTAGKIFALSVMLIFMALIVLKLMGRKLTPFLFLMIIYSQSALALYFLPQMHERYGYFIELVAVMIAVINIRYIWVPVTQILITFITYGYYYNYDKEKLIPFPVLSVCMLGIVIFMAYRTLDFKDENGPDLISVKKAGEDPDEGENGQVTDAGEDE